MDAVHKDSILEIVCKEQVEEWNLLYLINQQRWSSLYSEVKMQPFQLSGADQDPHKTSMNRIVDNINRLDNLVTSIGQDNLFEYTDKYPK